MKSLAIFAGGMLVTLAITIQFVDAGEDEDLRELATTNCELPGLYVKPPRPWYSVPIDSEEEIVDGCQMLWEQGDQYMGIMRLVSFDLRGRQEEISDWANFAIAFEAMVMEQMNFKLGDVLWRRDSVPITGKGFANARAIGLQASLDGVAHANEVHFLLFESDSHKYVISLITPSESASPDIYQANTDALGAVMRTLQPTK